MNEFSVLFVSHVSLLSFSFDFSAFCSRQINKSTNFKCSSLNSLVQFLSTIWMICSFASFSLFVSTVVLTCHNPNRGSSSILFSSSLFGSFVTFCSFNWNYMLKSHAEQMTKNKKVAGKARRKSATVASMSWTSAHKLHCRKSC